MLWQPAGLNPFITQVVEPELPILWDPWFLFGLQHTFLKNLAVIKTDPQVMRASTISLGVAPILLQVIKILNKGSMKPSKVHSPNLNISKLKETLAGEHFLNF